MYKSEKFCDKCGKSIIGNALDLSLAERAYDEKNEKYYISIDLCVECADKFYNESLKPYMATLVHTDKDWRIG